MELSHGLFCLFCGLAFYQVAFYDIVQEQFRQLARLELYIRQFSNLASKRPYNGFRNENLGDGIGVYQLGFFEMLLSEVFFDGRFVEDIQQFPRVFRSRIQRRDIKLRHKIVSNRLFKPDFIEFPYDAVCKYYPTYALVCPVVNRLFQMVVLQFRADGFALHKVFYFVVHLYREVAKSIADGKFARYFKIFIVSKNII